MRVLDRFLQRWRIRQCLRHLPAAARVIDVGAFQGELFAALGPRLREGFGVEPLCSQPVRRGNCEIRPGFFPRVRPDTDGWDAITMLAVLEHIPRTEQAELAKACYELLRGGGRVVITVPSAAVDAILAVLRFLRLIDGMSLDEHFGFEPAETPLIFAEPRFRLVRRERFQLGLNHLYVFEKTTVEQ